MNSHHRPYTDSTAVLSDVTLLVEVQYLSCNTLYSECCTAPGGLSYTIVGTASVESLMECPHC